MPTPPGSVPSAPLPKIASLDVPGPPVAAFEETQRWPTARVRVAQAPLELPVSDVPYAPPDVDENATPAAGGLDALFPGESQPPAPRPALKPEAGLEAPPSLSFGGEPAPADDEREPAPEPEPEPSSARESSFFGAAGGMLGDDESIPVGGSGFDAFPVEVTDPSARSATVEDLAVTVEEPTRSADAEPLDMVEVDELSQYKDLLGPAVTPAAPAASGEGEPVMPPPSLTAPPPPRSTQTEPYLTLKGLKDLSLTPPPQPAPPAAAPASSTDPFLPVWSTPPPSPSPVPPPARPAVAASAILGNEPAVPLPSLPPQAEGETFFDDFAFGPADPAPPGSPLDPAAWQVQAPQPAPEELPVVVGGDDDLPVVVGSTPSHTPPPQKPGWIVGEPAKK